jgi:beta-lactamase regulating signal transducer with metallopeptidase domain
MLVTQLAAFITGFVIYYSASQQVMEEGMLSHWIKTLAPAGKNFMIATWICNVYLVVVIFKIIKAIYTWYQFKQQYKTGLIKPDVDLKLFTKIKANHFGIKRKVTLWLSNTINTPVTFGFFKPVILLPVALTNNISIQQAETLILHELTHIKTNDYLLNWFVLASETIFFFNPFIYLLGKKIRLEREKYCDLNVMAFSYPASLYAETLLNAERIKHMVPGFQLAAVRRKNQLLQRIRFFSVPANLDQHNQSGSIIPMISLLLVFVLFTALLFRANNVATGTSTTNLTSPLLPVVNSIESNNIEFNNQPFIENNFVDSITAFAETKAPDIEKHIIKMQPLIQNLKKKSAEIVNQAILDFAIPVVEKENDADRQIIIKEESSGTKTSSVKAYRISFENGQWVLTPEWIATARENLMDSMSRKADSTNHNMRSTQ